MLARIDTLPIFSLDSSCHVDTKKDNRASDELISNMNWASAWGNHGNFLTLTIVKDFLQD